MMGRRSTGLCSSSAQCLVRTRPNNHYTAKGSGAEERDKICKLSSKPWPRQVCIYTAKGSAEEEDKLCKLSSKPWLR